MAHFPKLYLHRGTGYFCCNIAGKRNYLSRDRVDAERLHAELIRDLAAGRASPAPKRSASIAMVDELLSDWLKWAEQRYRKRGQVTHEVSRLAGTVRTLRPLVRGMRVDEVDEFVIEQFVQTVAKTCCRIEVNRRLSAVKRMFKWGHKRRLVPPATLAPILMVEGLRRGSGQAKERAQIQPVADWAVEATLDYCGPVLAAMIRVHRLTGMRPIEVTHLRPCDLDCSGDVWTYRVADDANKLAHHEIARSVQIGPRAQSILIPLLARDPEAFCFSPAEDFAAQLAQRRAARKTPRWPSHERATAAKRRQAPKRRPSCQYTTNTYAGSVRHAIKRANAARLAAKLPLIPRWSPNQLRHALATELRRTCGLDAAQVQLGHTTSVMTERYAKPDAEAAIEAMRRIG